MSTLTKFNLAVQANDSFARHQHYLNHEPLSESNEHIYRITLRFWSFVVCDLLSFQKELSDQSQRTRLYNFLAAANAADVTDVLDACKLTYDHIIGVIAGKVKPVTWSEFKAHLYTCMCGEIDIGKLFSPVLSLIKELMNPKISLDNGVYHSPATASMKLVSQFLLFPTKIILDREDLREKALQDYIAAEDECRAFELSGIPNTLITRAQEILRDALKEWSYDGSLCRHGSGSVADCHKSKAAKYEALNGDLRLQQLLSHDPFAIRREIVPIPRVVNGDWARCSKLCFVPKTYSKLRTISMEPAALQFTQQGVMRSLYRFFEKTKYRGIGKHLRLADQGQNRSLAYDGSITNRYATIDLSHASDSVNWKLVKVLFKKVPQLSKWLIGTRSDFTLLPDGSKLRLAKFAPMGSALCFPVESLVFYTIARLAVERCYELGLDVEENGHRNTFISVYGDDIIVPAYAANMTISYLKLFGFTPNEEKSYLSGPFKESCGGNYFCGTDITPIKFKYKPNFDYTKNGFIGPDTFSGLVAYANLAYSKSLKVLRTGIIHYLLDNGLHPVFTGEKEVLDRSESQLRAALTSVEQVTSAIYSPTPTNFHLKKEVDADYQSEMLLCTGIKASYSKTRATDELVRAAYFEKLQSMDSRTSESIMTNGFERIGNTLVSRCSTDASDKAMDPSWSGVECQRCVNLEADSLVNGAVRTFGSSTLVYYTRKVDLSFA